MTDIITGEKIQKLCDIYVGNDDDFMNNPLISKEKDKQIRFDMINSEYDNPKIIFCYGHNISIFYYKLDFFKNPFILITHNSDYCIEDNFSVRGILNCKNLIKWYAQNVCIFDEKLMPLPIGIANSMWGHNNSSFYDLNNIRNLHKTKLNNIYFRFSIINHPNRNVCYNELRDKLTFLDHENSWNNLKRLSTYKFCICPEGNGVDTHRLWECLYLQTIPIVLKTSFVLVLKEKLDIPMIILNKWSDLDETVLKYDSYVFDETYYKKLEMNMIKNMINNI